MSLSAKVHKSGLSTDSKGTSGGAQWTYLETDTGKYYNGDGVGGWTLVVSPTTTTSGTYTPTRSAEANLDANVTMSEAQYLRVGNTVTVSGRFTADPTLTVTATSFEITLPIASNLGAAEDCAGVAFGGGIEGMGAAISGSAANNTAVFSWIAVDVTSQVWSYIFSYQVI